MKSYEMKWYTIGKETVVNRKELSVWYVFRDNDWIRPEKELKDRLDKYLRSKAKQRYPDIREITYEEMTDRISENTVRSLIDGWKNEFEDRKQEFEKAGNWPMKLVTIEFLLREKMYRIDAGDLDCSDAFMDSVMDRLLADLEKAGATILSYGGFYD